MKTILMKTRAASEFGIFLPGHTYQMDDGTADAWIRGGYAEEVGSPPLEAQTLAPLETATKPQAKPQPRKQATHKKAAPTE